MMHSNREFRRNFQGLYAITKLSSTEFSATFAQHWEPPITSGIAPDTLAFSHVTLPTFTATLGGLSLRALLGPRMHSRLRRRRHARGMINTLQRDHPWIHREALPVLFIANRYARMHLDDERLDADGMDPFVRLVHLVGLLPAVHAFMDMNFYLMAAN